jgi:hypothetical protein
MSSIKFTQENSKKEELLEKENAVSEQFKKQGINPNEMPKATFHENDKGVKSYACTIKVICYLFATDVTVTFTDGNSVVHEFFGVGGLGVPGPTIATGVLLCGDLPTLLKAKVFYLTFTSAGIAAVNINWGSSGNASAAGGGFGGGVVFGSGNWS